jgi:hypothetical protein
MTCSIDLVELASDLPVVPLSIEGGFLVGRGFFFFASQEFSSFFQYWKICKKKFKLFFLDFLGFYESSIFSKQICYELNFQRLFLKTVHHYMDVQGYDITLVVFFLASEHLRQEMVYFLLCYFWQCLLPVSNRIYFFPSLKDHYFDPKHNEQEHCSS